jgi:hypothetical protein
MALSLVEAGLEQLPIKLSHRHCERSEAIYASAAPRLPISLRSRRDRLLRFARNDGARRFSLFGHRSSVGFREESTMTPVLRSLSDCRLSQNVGGSSLSLSVERNEENPQMTPQNIRRWRRMKPHQARLSDAAAEVAFDVLSETRCGRSTTVKRKPPPLERRIRACARNSR